MDPQTAWLLDWRAWLTDLGLMAASCAAFLALGAPVWWVLRLAEKRGCAEMKIRMIAPILIVLLLGLAVPAGAQTTQAPVSGQGIPPHGGISLASQMAIATSGTTGAYTTLPGPVSFFFTVHNVTGPVVNGPAVGFVIQVQDPATFAWVQLCQTCGVNWQGAAQTPAQGTVPLLNLPITGTWRVAYNLQNATNAVISIGVSF